MRLLAKRLLNQLSVEEYNIGILPCSQTELISLNSSVPIRWLTKGPDIQYQADPFPVIFQGRRYILYERLRFGHPEAEICASEIEPGGELGPASVVLSPGTHCSYPYCFTDNEQLYCVPETSSTGEVALYEVQGPPLRLHKVRTLLTNVRVADATVFKYRDAWWLMGCSGPPDEKTIYKLFAWFAPTLSSPWTPHPCNPIKTDPSSSRPAGTPFWLEGDLYRPSQDCLDGYGLRTVINRIVALSPDGAYVEEAVASITPETKGPYPLGLHTVSIGAGIIAVDGKRRTTTMNPVKLAFKALARARRTGLLNSNRPPL